MSDLPSNWIVSWTASLLAILGAALVSFQCIEGWYIWLFSNLLWIYRYWKEDWGMVAMMAVYEAVCLNGIIQWGK